MDGLLPDIAFFHAVTNIDSAFDEIGGGSALVSWSVRGVRTHSGHTWAVTRTNRFTSKRDISVAAVRELARALYRLQEQDLAPISFTGVDIDVEVQQTRREYKIDRVLWSQNGGGFHSVHALTAQPGDGLVAKVRLEASDDGSTKNAELAFMVPQGAHNGTIRISGGAGHGLRVGHQLLCELAGNCRKGGEAQSFDELLGELATAPRNDSLSGRASFGRHQQTRSEQQSRVVTGSRTLRVIVGP